MNLPTHRISNTTDDQRLTKASVPPLEDIVYNAMKICIIDMKRMKYLKYRTVDDCDEIICVLNS